MAQDNASDKVEIVKFYYKSGALLAETPYKNGKRNGIDKNFYESGSLCLETPYVNGMIHGIARQYYESGDLEWEIPYVNEKEHGVEKHYDSDKLNIDCLRLYDKGCEVLILCCESYGNVSTKS